MITFPDGKVKKYMTVGKIFSSSFERAQPGVSSFIRLGDMLSQSQKTENATLQKKAKIGRSSFAFLTLK